MNNEYISSVAAPVVDTSANATGDSLGGKLSFVSSKFNGSTNAKILGAVITDLAKQSANIDIVLFSSDPSATTFTTNIALDVDDADIGKIFGVISLTTHAALSDSSVSVNHSVSIPIPSGLSGTIYGALVSRGTPTYAAASDLTVRLIVG